MKGREIKEEKKNYANIVTSDDSSGVGYDDVTFFPCDYIIRCVDGKFDGRQVRMNDFGGQILIGSGNGCNFCLDDQEVSENHCVIRLVENTYYHEVEDLDSVNGTWIKISSLEDAYEVKVNTTFFISNNEFIIYKDNEDHIIEFTKGSRKGFKSILLDEFLIDKKDTSENIDFAIKENLTYRIIKYQKRVFVRNDTLEITNDGLYYKMHKNEIILIKAGDMIKIGGSYFRILNHNWGMFSEIGDRPNQEDRYCIIDDLRLFDDICIPYYAVYDGHVGGTCSIYLQKHLHRNIREIIKSRELNKKENFFVELCDAIQDAIIFTDLSYYTSGDISLSHGSTCVFIFIIGNKVLCCNLGDSMCIYIRNKKKIFLSKDFKPSRPKETGRIQSKGAYITDERLIGVISVSRGFGDWRFKDPTKQDQLRKYLMKSCELKEYVISNRAEFRILEINPEEDEYLILCSDGIFQQSNNNNHIFDIIDRYLTIDKANAFSSNIQNIPYLMDNTRLDVINSMHSTSTTTKESQSDNMTLILVHLQNNK